MEIIKIAIEVPPLLANCLQRMLVEEIEKQETWIVQEEKEFGISIERQELREKIIAQCEELRNQLEEKGITKYYKCM